MDDPNYINKEFKSRKANTESYKEKSVQKKIPQNLLDDNSHDAGHNEFYLSFFTNITDLNISNQNTESLYIEQAKNIEVLLKKKINMFIKACYYKMSNFIIHLPEYPLNDINCNLCDLNGQHILDFIKINKILEDPIQQILYPSIIVVAIKLGIGKVKAIYEMHYSGFASFDYTDSLARTVQDDVIFICKFQYPLVKYLVKLTYEITEINSIIPLLNLHFEYELRTKYTLVSSELIEQHIEENSKLVKLINTNPTTELNFFWEHSILIKKDKINYNKFKNCLNKITHYVVENILMKDSLECKNIKKNFLEYNNNFYYSQLNNIFYYYRNILLYAELAGVSKEEINLFNDNFDVKNFIEDFINLPLISYEQNSDQNNLLFKYTNLVNELMLSMDKLNSTEKGSNLLKHDDIEISSSSNIRTEIKEISNSSNIKPKITF